jgi:hypothetical protein
MIDFVHGTVVDNLSETGEYFHVILQPPNDRLIEVADSMIPGEPERALAEQLIPGETYHLLLMLTPRTITRLGVQPDQSHLRIHTKAKKYFVRNQDRKVIDTKTYHLHEINQGKISDLHWTIAKLPEEQQQALAELQNETYLLIETDIGHLIINHMYLNTALEEQTIPLVAGEYITWRPPHPELLAILGPYIAFERPIE